MLFHGVLDFLPIPAISRILTAYRVSQLKIQTKKSRQTLKLAIVKNVLGSNWLHVSNHWKNKPMPSNRTLGWQSIDCKKKVCFRDTLCQKYAEFNIMNLKIITQLRRWRYLLSGSKHSQSWSKINQVEIELCGFYRLTAECCRVAKVEKDRTQLPVGSWVGNSKSIKFCGLFCRRVGWKLVLNYRRCGLESSTCWS